MTQGHRSPLHPPMTAAKTAAAKPSPAAVSMTGTATFISATTPESDVNVDEPVKFIARNAESAGKNRSTAAAAAKSAGPPDGNPPIKHTADAQRTPKIAPFAANIPMDGARFLFLFGDYILLDLPCKTSKQKNRCFQRVFIMS